MYATVWSFGACVDTVSRKQFDIIIKRIFTLELGSNRKRRYAQLPEKMTLYDYHFEANHSTMDY